ncbi:hypothetical protein [Leifsonia poae]|uniref:Uncharacterized protein n=1 Tax=Leifsonia poae TaxID=110933 RepID=A0A9W6HCB7_9MICO|nr:hypothetical protein [Leifsonia poae]GLJ77869.1 hypothetical protein GCM10017584_34430 [Leifsonia poae]
MSDAHDDQSTTVPAEPVAPEVSVPPELVGPAVPEPERVARGLALALVVIPVGVAAWVLLWNIGFIASIVSYGVSFGAVWLYRVGSKARVTRASFWGVLAIIVVTVVLSLGAGIFSDLVQAVGIPLSEALSEPQFWSLFWRNIFTNGDLWSAYLPQIVLALAFAALGCYRTIRMLANESRR